MTSFSPLQLKPIGWIETEFATKFGIPRQSGLVEELEARILFLPEYRVREAFRGLEGFSHIWLLWEFSESRRKDWSPTVRPPRLGGNRRLGVFATRSPFRPNPIGLSCVRLIRVEPDASQGPVLHVAGADLLNGTPIFDIKPYLPYADSRPDAAGGFAGARPEDKLTVHILPEAEQNIPENRKRALVSVLSEDPRPSYQNDPERVYGMEFAGLEVKFRVEGETLTVLSVQPGKAGPFPPSPGA